MAIEIEKSLEKVRERIIAACRRVDRDPREITLVAVSKYVDAPEVLEAVAAGVSIVGENRVQELLRKYEIVGNRVHWHLIGHLQRNKVKYLPGKVELIHSLDSIELARELDKHRNGDAPWDVLVQVNVAHEETKFGISPDVLPELLTQLQELSGIRVRGLMTIAPFCDDPEQVRPVFKGLRQLRDRMATEMPQLELRELSMGMSNDFEVAIEEGATMVRIGSAIFGGYH